MVMFGFIINKFAIGFWRDPQPLAFEWILTS